MKLLNIRKRKGKGLSLREREILYGFLFIAPWLLGAGMFFLRSMWQAIVYSVSSITIKPEGGYTLAGVGLKNYTYALLEHGTYNSELTASLIKTLVDLPLIIFLSFFMAILLNRKFVMRSAVRAIFFLPVIMATPAITNALNVILQQMLGGVSSIPPEILRQQRQEGFDALSVMRILARFGMPMFLIRYVTDVIASLYETIRAAGVQILIFLAALQAIPGSLYEVAQIEGATAYETFWKITFPMVSPLILTNVVYTIIDTYSRSTIVTIILNTAFVNQNFGLSSAMSLISSFLVCLILGVVGYFVSRNIFYQT